MSELKAVVLISPNSTKHHAPVIATQAINSVGIEELYQELEKLLGSLLRGEEGFS